MPPTASEVIEMPGPVKPVDPVHRSTAITQVSLDRRSAPAREWMEVVREVYRKKIRARLRAERAKSKDADAD
jgi:hypothetical protein